MLSVLRLPILLILVSHIISFTSGSPILTNAQRLAKGLPLGEPRGYGKRMINGVSRTIPYSEKIVARWNKPIPSSSPSVLKGIIQVNCKGSQPKYINKNLKRGSHYKETDKKDNALVVAFSSKDTSKPFGLIEKNGNPSFPWVGFSVVNSGATLGSGSADFVTLVGIVSETAAGQGPETVWNSAGDSGSETDLWTLHQNNELVPTWVNPDGKPFNEVLFFDETDNLFGITGDLDEYKKAHSSHSVFEVTFTFIFV